MSVIKMYSYVFLEFTTYLIKHLYTLLWAKIVILLAWFKGVLCSLHLSIHLTWL